MILTTASYERYMQSLSNAPEPVSPKDPIFSVKINWKDLMDYAHSLNKTIKERTDRELEPYIEGGLDNLKKLRGW